MLGPRISAAPVQAGVVRPLIQNVHFHELSALEHAVLGEHRHIERRQQFSDAVIDLGVDMIGPPRQHNELFALALRLVDDLAALFLDRGIIGGQGV